MRLFISLIYLLLLPLTAFAQPAFVDVKTATTTNPFSSITVSSLAVSGSNPGVAVCVVETSTSSVSTVVFNGSESLTLIAQDLVGGVSAELWYLGAATATTADVVVTMAASGSGASLATAIAYSGVSASNPTLFDTDDCSSCTTLSAGFTTTAANTMAVTCARGSTSTSSWTHGTGQNERSDFDNTTASDESSSTSDELIVSPGSETLTSTLGTTGDLGYAVMGIEPFDAGGGGGGRRRGAPWVQH